VGRATVRAAVASLLSNGAVPYVGQVYPARPVIMQEQDYEFYMVGQAAVYVSSTNGSAAVLVVNIPQSERQRRADTGRGAVNDSAIHDIVLEVFFASVGGEGIAAQADHDTITDAIVTLVRSSPTLANRVWSSGEFDAGVRVDEGEPYTDEAGLTVFIPTTIHWQVYEWDAGAAGTV